MYNLTVVSEATHNKIPKIITHIKYIRKKRKFGIYNGVDIMLTSDEFGQYAVFALDVRRLKSMEMALENLVLSRTNTPDLLKIIKSASEDLADLAKNEQKYFDIPLGLK
ncbi:hypothetical protein [Lysinibacillus fusiformis]|uniref:hypothetical protein n=1 Tax=Lysinibacillus fusiformis TaxID=28031 RepID=UPI000D3B60E4|nr:MULTISPECIES: hypothetical protein [Lysinibacillus]MED4672094.1 hypothetical protein [Lysinibacillus fusiformis]QAS57412.1 hypothetical protein LSP_14175 [Lysinibacillus sphaericus]RDV26991.1 hypothetical protein C7B90_20035 [Lysinibacillus fusiformis]GED65128.1 hypothetical protein LFU01_35800 [Lysinibacillus fusiformis]